MKVEEKPRIFLYSWLSTGTYHKNLVILVFGNLGHFSMKNHLDQNPIVIFQVKVWQKFTQKNC
jgi:hypothetical protein